MKRADDPTVGLRWIGVRAFFVGPHDISSVARFYWFEVITSFFIFAVALYALVSSSYNVPGSSLLYPSLICYLACFTLTSSFLKRQGVQFLDRLFISVLSMVSGIILFEIVYHYGFGIPSLDYFWTHELTFLGNQSANGYFSLDWYLLIFSSLFVARKYMAFNIPLFALALLSAIVMFAWIGSGYPQLFDPPWFANYLPIYKTFHVAYSSPNMIDQYARYFNGFAKIISIIPAFLFYKALRAF
jgi:hypothetical protein